MGSYALRLDSHDSGVPLDDPVVRELKPPLAYALHAHLLEEAPRQDRVYGARVGEEEHLPRALGLLDVPDLRFDPDETHGSPLDGVD
jgi:hypothetical protein